MNKTFVGIGFGPIQSGLFLLEAFQSGNFHRLVVAEVAEDVVRAVRSSNGTYAINVAESDKVRTQVVEGIEILNPADPNDQTELVSAIASAHEISTALPSVEFFSRGSPSPAELLARGFERRLEQRESEPAVVYAAENHNHAAELLRDEVHQRLSPPHQESLPQHVQFVNTVIGKMSGVVTDRDQIQSDGLQPLVSSDARAVLVEEFNRILVEEIRLSGFQRGLDVFLEKPELAPFEEAKLYGHNAAHALMGYLAQQRGLRFMSEVRNSDLMETVQDAFLVESGEPLCERYQNTDALFTQSGWKAYVDDLLDRMTNPFLNDHVERVIRDPRRKLGWHDRLIGTMRMALESGIEPVNYALGAAAAARLLMKEQTGSTLQSILEELWVETETQEKIRATLLNLIAGAMDRPLS